MVDFEKSHVVIQSTYKNILENFNPGLKQLITTGKALQKGLHNVGSYANTYLSCLYDLARSAQSCEGGNAELGDAISHLAEAYTQINQQIADSIKHFHSELLIPLKAKQENEFRHIQICLDKYMIGHKYHSARLVKSQVSLAKLKKKAKPSKSQTFNKKEVQCSREVKEYHRMFEEFMAKHLRLALIEERKRYSYLFSKLTCLAQDDGNNHAKAHELLTHRMKDWTQLCKNPHILSKHSEQFIQDLGFSQDAFASLEDLRTAGLDPQQRRATLTGIENFREVLVDDRSKENQEQTNQQQTQQLPGINYQNHSQQLVQQNHVHPPSQINATAQEQQFQQQLMLQQQNRQQVVVQQQQQQQQYVDRQKYNTLSHVPISFIKQEFQDIEKASAAAIANQSQTQSQQLEDETAPLRSALFQLKAVHSFQAANDSQLTIEAGDVVSVYDDINQGGWIFGLNENTNKIGWFPFSYTQVAELESLKTLSERLANLEDVFVNKRSSRSLNESPNFNDSRFKAYGLPPPEKFQDIFTRNAGTKYIGNEDANKDYELEAGVNKLKLTAANQNDNTLNRSPPRPENKYEPTPVDQPRRPTTPYASGSASRGIYGSIGTTKTHRSLGALYSETLLRDMSHGPPPPPPPPQL